MPRSPAHPLNAFLGRHRHTRNSAARANVTSMIGQPSPGKWLVPDTAYRDFLAAAATAHDDGAVYYTQEDLAPVHGLFLDVEAGLAEGQTVDQVDNLPIWGPAQRLVRERFSTTGTDNPPDTIVLSASRDGYVGRGRAPDHPAGVS